MKRLLYILLLLLTAATGFAQTGSGIFGNVGVHSGGHIGVYNSLTAVTGYVVTLRAEPTANISWQPGASHAGTSDASHTNGYAETTGNTAFTFPIGNGTTYRPAGISAPSSGTFSAAYFSTNPSSGTLPTGAPFNTASLGTGVTGVSQVEYWDINGPSAVQLTLSWNAASGLNTLTGGTLANLAIVGWDGSKWVNLGGVATGTLSGTGTIASTTPVTPNTYSAYTFGTVSNCASPTVGGTVAYLGNLPVCTSSNVGSLTLTGNTGVVVKWQTSTDGGTTWTDIAGTLGKTSYNFVNAQNNQQYRAVVNNGTGCLDANATAITITTSSTACTSGICDSQTGSLSINIVSQGSGANLTAQVVAVDASGVIRAFSAAGGNSIAGLPVGDYQVYHVVYDNTQTPLPAIAVGTSVSAVGGACVRWSNAVAFRVCAPPTVAITGPAPGTLVATTNPPITGTATPGSSVTVTGGPGTTGGPCVVVASNTGSWTCTSLTFTPGSQTVTAIASNSAGTSNPAVNTFTVTNPPTLTVVQPPVPGPPTQPITGTATPGSLIAITDPTGQTVCNTTASVSGTFSCPVTSPPGVTSLTVTACNPGGCISKPTVVTVVAPPTIAITGPTGTLTTTTPTVSGTATPGALVAILGPGSTTLCSTTATQAGNYSCVVNVAPGVASLTATATTPGGTATATTSFTATGQPTLTVQPPVPGPTTQPITGTATPGSQIAITDPTGNTLCTTTASVSGTFSCPVTVSPGVTNLTVTACNPGGCVTRPTTVTALIPPTLVVQPPVPGPPTQPVVGTATPGSLITITDPTGQTVCNTTASVSGTFSCPVTLPPGVTSLTVTACNPGGCTNKPTTVTVLAPPTIAVNPLPAISPLSPTVSGTATPGARVDIVGPNNMTLCTTTATAGGNYSCVVNLTPGPQTLTAVATNPGGSASATTNSFTATGPPTLTVVQPVTPGPVTQPVVGTATPGTLITITGPGPQTFCSTTASVSGTFTCSVSLTSPVTTLTVTACNPAGCTTQPVTLSVAQPPVVTPDIAITNPETPVTGNVLTNDKDPQGLPLTATLTTPPTVGTATVSPDGSYTYTPPAGFTGTTSFCYTASNTAGQSNSSCVTVNVTPAPVIDPSPNANNRPIANNDNTQTTAGTPVTVPVLANDTDPDATTRLAGQLNNPTLLSQPAQGTAVVNSNGTITYTPPTGFTGPVSIPYQVCDKGTPALCSTATMGVNVQPTPPTGTTLAPVAIDDALLTTVNTPKTGTVATNDSDPAGLPLTYTSGQPASGTVTMQSNGSYTYTPAPGFVGPASFTYNVCNPVKCQVANVSVLVQEPLSLTLTPPVPGPLTQPVTGTTTPGANVVITDPTGRTVCNTTASTSGTFSCPVTLTATGPNPLTVTACKSGGCVSQPTVLTAIGPPGLTVAQPVVPGPPTQPVVGTATPGSLIAITDPTGRTLCTTTASVSGTFSCPVSLTSPVTTMTVTACNTAGCTTRPVTLSVAQPPVVTPDIANTNSGTPVSGNVLTNDSDPNGLPLTATLTTPPTVGTATISPDGSYTYTPPTGFTGTTTFCYTASNTAGQSNSTCVTVNVNPAPTTGPNANNRPIANNDNTRTTAGMPVTVPVLANDTDPNGPGSPNGQLSNPTLLTPPAVGTAVVNNDGTVTYTPPAGFTGTVSIPYQVCDKGTPTLCSTATMNVNVQPAPPTSPIATPQSPVAVDDALLTTKNTSATGTVATNDRDPNSPAQALTYASGQPRNGTVTMQPNGSYTYTPQPGFVGPDSFTYNVCNPAALCEKATVSVLVQQPANQPPIVTPDFVDVIPGIPAKGNVLTNDKDPEGTPLTAQVIGTPPPGLTLSPDGSYTYTAPVGTTAPVTVPVQVCDSNTPPACTTTTLTLVPVLPIQPGNNPPIANPDSPRTTAGVPLTVNVTANDVDPDGPTLGGNPLSAPLIISGPRNGTAVVNPDGTVSYTPAPGYTGPDQLVYRVCDLGTPPLCATAAVNLTVDPTRPAGVTNTAPVAIDDALLTTLNTSATGTVAANDRDPEGQSLTFSKLSSPTNGTVVLSPNGSYSFTPAPGFAGTDNFVYQVCDGASPALCSTATAYLTVANPAAPSAYLLQVRVLLQGALFNVNSGTLMRDDLRTGGYLPLTSPYSVSVSGRFAQTGGGGGETTSSAVLRGNAGTPDAIVDWVLVELRNPANPALVVATRSALVQRDGDVVLPADGVSPLSFTGLTGTQYFVSVKHRNHLGVMTATALPLSVTGTLVDFTTMTNVQVYDKPGAVNYNGVEMISVNGKRALWAGDANADGKVKYIGGASDNTPILNDVIGAQGSNPSPQYNYDFAFGYLYGDVDMNSKAKYQGAVNDPTWVFSNVVATFPLNTLELYNYDFLIEQIP